jgi:MoxR-like ATPase
MKAIVAVHFPNLKKELLSAALKNFYDVRNLPGLKKKPSTSELLDWLKLLLAEDIPLEVLQNKDDKVAVPPLVGALLKNEQDVSLFEKLVFMQKNNR